MLSSSGSSDESEVGANSNDDAVDGEQSVFSFLPFLGVSIIREENVKFRVAPHVYTETHSTVTVYWFLLSSFC